MRLTALAAIALCAACGSSSMNYPPPPSGGGTDGGGLADAPNAPADAPLPDAMVLGDGGTASTLTGRVCLATDPRDLRACASTGAGGLQVQLGDATALTADDGSFTIAGSFATGMVWHVTGASIVPSIMELPDYQIPAITTAAYTAMLSQTGASLQPGQGTLMVTLIQNGMSPTGSTASLNPPGFYQPFYDAATGWVQGTGVGSGGTVWLPGVDVGNVTLTADLAGTTTKLSTPTQPIEDHAITYYVLAFP